MFTAFLWRTRTLRQENAEPAGCCSGVAVPMFKGFTAGLDKGKGGKDGKGDGKGSRGSATPYGRG